MLDHLPSTSQEIMNWDWASIEKFYQELEACPLDQRSVDAWLADWSERG